MDEDTVAEPADVLPLPPQYEKDKEWNISPSPKEVNLEMVEEGKEEVDFASVTWS